MAQMHGYVRVSRRNGRGGDRYISPSEQERAVREAAARIGVELVDIVIEEDVSGSLPAEKRRLGEVLVACEEGRSSGVIVSNVDRLTRASKLDEAIIFERLSRAGARFVAANEGIDTDSPGADLTLDIMAAVARAQWRRYRDNWADARRRAVERGVAARAHVPFGYAVGNDGRLFPVSEEVNALRAAYALRARGASWTEVAAHLDASGLEPRQGWAKARLAEGRRRWIGKSVARMLRNDVYLGVVRLGDLVNEEAHEPIVTRAVWLAVQSERPGRLCRSEQGTRLAGILRCAGCGGRMTPSRSTNAYRCLDRRSGPPCPSRAYLRMDEGDEHVVAAFLARYEPLVGDLDDEDLGGPDVAPLRRKLERAEDTLDRLLSDLGALAALSPVRRKDVIDRAQQTVEEAQAVLDLALVDHETSVVNVWNLSDLFTPDDFREASIPDQRRLLSLGIARIDVSKGGRKELGERVHITWIDEDVVPKANEKD